MTSKWYQSSSGKRCLPYSTSLNYLNSGSGNITDDRILSISNEFTTCKHQYISKSGLSTKKDIIFEVMI